MMHPSASNFARIRGRYFQGSRLRNPRWYKYDWWIYTERDAFPHPIPFYLSGANSRRVHDPETRLSTFEAMLRARDLDDHFETYFLFNWSIKRDDPSAPWNIDLVRRNGGRVAPNYDVDTDKPWRGHK